MEYQPDQEAGKEKEGEDQNPTPSKSFRWVPMYSSRLAAIAYSDGELRVQFTDGSSWSYEGVSRYEYEELLSAPSAGVYFNKNILGSYDHKKL